MATNPSASATKHAWQRGLPSTQAGGRARVALVSPPPTRGETQPQPPAWALFPDKESSSDPPAPPPRPMPERPTLTRLAEVLAAGEASGVLPELLWMIEQNTATAWRLQRLEEVARAGVGSDWQAVARVLCQLDILVESRQNWTHPSAVLLPPYAPLEALCVACCLRAEDAPAEERPRLRVVGDKLHRMLTLENRIAGRTP